jgi:hypothetical protein
MGPVHAFISPMIRRTSILLLAVAAALAAVVALAALSNRGKPVQAPAAAEDLDAETAPASGAPPEAGGQADVIPPDEGSDDQGAADTNNTDVPATQP